MQNRQPPFRFFFFHGSFCWGCLQCPFVPLFITPPKTGPARSFFVANVCVLLPLISSILLFCFFFFYGTPARFLVVSLFLFPISCCFSHRLVLINPPLNTGWGAEILPHLSVIFIVIGVQSPVCSTPNLEQFPPY